jgi:hydrogenase/urease accessory protein HupE|tara:strand:+ start:2719 stop:3765 length:1047 start_codon:yes stop_codon:yes gene_type:complete
MTIAMRAVLALRERTGLSVRIGLASGLLLGWWSLNASAHEMRPAYLEITQVDEERFEIFWKRPQVTGRSLRLDLRFPDHCSAEPVGLDQVTDSAWISRMMLNCPAEGLSGHAIVVDGLSGTMTDILVRMRWLNGRNLSHILKPDRPAFEIDAAGGDPAGGLLAYLRLGVEHLLTGFDHVLFVIGLLFLGRSNWELVRIVTSFTVAHSVTLGLSALDLVRLSQTPVEAVIALSILFLAVELAKGDRSSLLFRQPWSIAFTFGLLHGFGFAGALREIGLPSDAILWALLLFNIGVEVGQLVVVLAGLTLLFLLRSRPVELPGWLPGVPVWGIGVISAYWLIGRTTLMVTS